MPSRPASPAAPLTPNSQSTTPRRRFSLGSSSKKLPAVMAAFEAAAQAELSPVASSDTGLSDGSSSSDDEGKSTAPAEAPVDSALLSSSLDTFMAIVLPHNTVDYARADYRLAKPTTGWSLALSKLSSYLTTFSSLNINDLTLPPLLPSALATISLLATFLRHHSPHYPPSSTLLPLLTYLTHCITLSPSTFTANVLRISPTFLPPSLFPSLSAPGLSSPTTGDLLTLVLLLQASPTLPLPLKQSVTTLSSRILGNRVVTPCLPNTVYPLQTPLASCLIAPLLPHFLNPPVSPPPRVTSAPTTAKPPLATSLQNYTTLLSQLPHLPPLSTGHLRSLLTHLRHPATDGTTIVMLACVLLHKAGDDVVKSVFTLRNIGFTLNHIFYKNATGAAGGSETGVTGTSATAMDGTGLQTLSTLLTNSATSGIVGKSPVLATWIQNAWMAVLKGDFVGRGVEGLCFCHGYCGGVSGRVLEELCGGRWERVVEGLVGIVGKAGFTEAEGVGRAVGAARLLRCLATTGGGGFWEGVAAVSCGETIKSVWRVLDTENVAKEGVFAALECLNIVASCWKGAEGLVTQVREGGAVLRKVSEEAVLTTVAGGGTESVGEGGRPMPEKGGFGVDVAVGQAAAAAAAVHNSAKFEFKIDGLDEEVEREKKQTPARRDVGAIDEDAGVVKYGVGGIDYGSSAIVPAFNAILACTLLARLSVGEGRSEGGGGGSVDVLRRRRSTIKKNLSAAIMGQGKRALAHGLTQNYSKVLTGAAVELSALMARMGGMDAVVCKEALFEFCESEVGEVRREGEKNKERERELVRVKEELSKTAYERDTLQYDLEQKEAGWGRELEQEKSRAVGSATELARYHEKGREESEQRVEGLLEKVRALEEEKEGLRRKLEKRGEELGRINSTAQRALAEEVEAKQKVVAGERCVWEEREKLREMKAELNGLRKERDGLGGRLEVVEKENEGGREMWGSQQALIRYMNELSGVGDLGKVGQPPQEVLEMLGEFERSAGLRRGIGGEEEESA